MKKPKEICIGERIKEIFDKSNMTKSQFVEMLNYERPNVNNIFRRKKIDIDLLLEISKILNYDFVGEVYKKHGLSKDVFNHKISIILEINNVDDKTLKKLLNTIKQLEIKTICKK